MNNAPNFKAALDSAEVISISPQPLYRDLPEPTQFPIEALGPVLGPAVKAIEGVVQCPRVCAANSVLAVASLAAQGRADVILPIGEGKLAPLSLFLLTVLDSGERKSTADGYALKPVRAFEAELAESGASERIDYSSRLAAHEANTKHLTNKNKADPAALAAALRDLGAAPLPPLGSQVALSGDQTMEGLFRVYQSGRPALGMLCDDAATFLGGHSLKAEQKASTTGNLCRAWDGSKLERVRSGDGVTILYDRRLATHLMVQSGVAAEFLSDVRFADQGLLARFLVAAPAGRAGTRLRDDEAYQAISSSAVAQLERYNAAITNLLRAPIRWKNEDDRSVGVHMDRLKFSPEARAIYLEAYNATEKALGPHGELEAVKAFASKLPENAGRIAGILTLLQSPQARTIDAETMGAAIQLARFYLAEFLRLNASGAIDPELKQAKVLLDWMRGQDSTFFPLSTIYQRGPNSIRQAAKARTIMQLLEAHGWAVPVEGGTEHDGKFHKEIWRLVPC